MPWVKVAEYVALAVGVVGGLFLGWKEWKERKARATGLAPNPTRCEDHEARLRGVEKMCNELGPKISGIETGLSEVKDSLSKLIDLHLSK